MKKKKERQELCAIQAVSDVRDSGWWSWTLPRMNRLSRVGDRAARDWVCCLSAGFPPVAPSSLCYPESAAELPS